MKRSALAPLLALALIPSACQFRACGLGCGSNGSSNIPSTPKVTATPLKVPDPLPGEHGLVAAWFDNAEGLMHWAKRFNPEAFPQDISPEALRDIIAKQTGSPQLAEHLDLTRPLGCVGFDVMEFMSGDTLPLSCVFHFEGGFKGLERALSLQNARTEDERLMVTIKDRQLTFEDWPATDAIWLTGDKTLAMQAKPVLEQKLGESQAGHQSRIELSLYVAQIMDEYKLFVRPMLKRTLKDLSSGAPIGSDTLDKTIDKTFNELENLFELRLGLRTTPNDAQFYFSESMAAESEQLSALDQTCKGPGINPHLLGLLPQNTMVAIAQNLDLVEAAKHAWTKENHDLFNTLMGFQAETADLPTHQEVSQLLQGIATHFEGNTVAAMRRLAPEVGALEFLYEPKAGHSPREFWGKAIERLAPHAAERFRIEIPAQVVTVQGVELDRFRMTVLSREAGEAPTVIVLDVGELDGIGIISCTNDQHIEAATQGVVEAIKGQGRFADTPNFKSLAAKFAGNHVGAAVDLVTLLNADPNRKNKLEGQGLGDLSLVGRGEPGKGLALQMSLLDKTIKVLSQGL